MKKFLFIFFLAFSLLAASSSAAIPSIQQTEQYQTLKNYATFLQSQSAVPVSSETKASYQLNLNNANTNAQSRVASLYNQRKTKLTNTYKRNQKKAIKKINKIRNKNIANAKNKYIQDIDYDRSVYQGILQGIYANYDPKISKVAKNIKKTQLAILKTTNALKKEELRAQLGLLRLKKENLLEDRKSAKKVAQVNYKKTIDEENQTYQRRLRKINSRADSNIASQKRTRKTKYNSYIQNAKSKRSTEYSLVGAQANIGQTAINAMPPLVG